MKELLVNSSRYQQILAKTLVPYTGTSGLYSSMVPTEESKLKILNLCARLGLPLTEEEEFHCTIIYSPDRAPDKEVVMRNIYPGTATALIVGFDVFGEEKDHLVMTLHSHEMAKIHYKWRALGCNPTWENYMPHVSLAKGGPFEQDLIDRATSYVLNNEAIQLEFFPEEIEDIS